MMMMNLQSISWRVSNLESLTFMLIYLQTLISQSEANYFVSNLVSPKLPSSVEKE